MRIACPNCGAEYEVPDAMLASGPRQLKCARCGHRFQAVAPGLPPAPPASRTPEEVAPHTPPPGPAPTAFRRPDPARPDPMPADPEPPDSPPADAASVRPPPTRGLAQHSPIEPDARPGTALPLALAWLLSFAVLGGAGYAGFFWRAEIMQAWPPATRLFAALGLG